ncbi:MAG: tetratricopeptide repeat protein [Sulfuricurvum sp.]|uniref:tetratricopeptide repeat protein n=1 Tax=Sulfuricurvum sp. TaxID=2025608 RepID=UPI0026136881|nr:tetratricopeptide repeat protein [Sulfuricurvum sp.]MDD2949484.1 tetratricopeptide repeat protein [Sulfuricurvum sp.]MDD5119170.1 tetratricopeptide repeat protein [Sulfuricurvum sp.]
MTFLHSEFFFWMLPGVAVLFYFWQTQKAPQSAPFSDEVLAQLRAPEITMGLRGRNTLLLAASILLIIAMAQPVILDEDAIGEGSVDVLIALDLSKKSREAFESEKVSAIDMVRHLRGENIALVGYDTRLYRISPYSTDTDMMVTLIEGLDPDVMVRAESNGAIVGKMDSDAVKVLIGDPLFEHNTPFSEVMEKIEKIKNSQRLYAHDPLFTYPLGLAMLLIWIALSSMSKRLSVPLTAVLLIVSIGETPSRAGMLDFRILQEGYSAYEQEDYTRSAEYFKRYQTIHDSPEVRYNLGNALYKAGEYQKACYWYRHVYTNNRLLAQRTAYNLGLCEQKMGHDLEETARVKSGSLSEDFLEAPSHEPIKPIGEKVKTRVYPM